MPRHLHTFARRCVLACLPLSPLCGCDDPSYAARTQAPLQSEQPVVSAAASAAPIIVDFGRVLSGVTLSRSVQVHNPLETTLFITRIVTSCGCSSAVAKEKTIVAGGSAAVVVTLDAPDRLGPIPSGRISVEFADGSESVEIEVKAVVVRPVTHEPHTLDPASGASTVLLRAEDGRAFRVIAVEPPVFKPTTPDGAAEIQGLELDEAAWRAHGRPRSAVLRLDHPDSPEVAVEVRDDTAGVSFRLRATPARLDFGEVSQGASQTRELTLRPLGGELDPSAQVSAYTTSLGLSVVVDGVETTPDGDLRIHVRITPAPGFLGRLRERVRVQAGGGSVSIEVVGLIVEREEAARGAS